MENVLSDIIRINDREFCPIKIRRSFNHNFCSNAGKMSFW
jgi:hypothetical protein